MKLVCKFVLILSFAFGGLTALSPRVSAQEMPSDCQDVLKSLDRKGDYKAGVLKVNIPRNDLKITVQGFSTPTPFGFGGWVALIKAEDGSDVLMGDLVLLQEEVSYSGAIAVFHQDDPDHYRKVEDFRVQRAVHTLAINLKTHRVYHT